MDDGHEVVAVFTREPKPAGRNQRLTKTPVHLFAEEKGLNVKTPKSLKNPDSINLEQLEEVDFIVVVAYGLILPKYFIDYPKFACLNVHPSLLPRWRGAAPIERTLWNGDKKTAATIMLMDEGLDTGDIVTMEEIEVEDEDNFQTLSLKLQMSANGQLIDVINNYLSYEPKKQSEDSITYAEKIILEDKKIDFSGEKNYSCYELHNRIRALSGKSGLMVKINNFAEEFKIFSSEYLYNNEFNVHDYGCGAIKDKKFYINCDDGILILKSVQRTSGTGKILTDKEFINYAEDKLDV
jgi:methionyl-tRNA formyltransferase